MDLDEELECVAVANDNRALISKFLDRLGIGRDSFRYFSKRGLNVLDNHLTTLLLIKNNAPIAYGHLDKEGDTVWLGIAVAEDAIGQGYGKRMMHELLEKARELEVEKISLTVDTHNTPAVRLYEKFGFELISENNKKNMFLFSIDL